uniref:Mitochondrial 2-oxodicarboxylate carrier n=1 Tax=Knipowitschia caucasica TaxID=637954 RepID=A0AAV2LGI0_KNICA
MTPAHMVPPTNAALYHRQTMEKPPQSPAPRPSAALTVAGLGSGLTEAVVVNPFEVVKVSLQANRDSFKEQPSSFAQARRIMNAGGFGLNGLNRGLTSTLGRHGIFNMIYFGFYFNVKDAFPASQDPTLEFMRKFAIGLVSGTISSCVNIPWDVAKSRIQGPQPVPGEIKYKTCIQTMKLVYKEEG